MISGKICLNCLWLKLRMNLSEEEFLASPQFQALVAEGEVRMVRSVCRGVKHVLSHRVIYANFYEVTLPENSASFAKYRKIKAEELGQYAVPRLVYTLLLRNMSVSNKSYNNSCILLLFCLILAADLIKEYK